MKKGCIKIQRHIYENDWHIVGQIFRQFKPFHIGFDGVKDQWVFTGTCDSFDDVPEHEPAPEYHTTIHSNAVTFQRAELPKKHRTRLLPLAMQILKDELQKTTPKTQHTTHGRSLYKPLSLTDLSTGITLKHYKTSQMKPPTKHYKTSLT